MKTKKYIFLIQNIEKYNIDLCEGNIYNNKGKEVSYVNNRGHRLFSLWNKSTQYCYTLASVIAITGGLYKGLDVEKFRTRLKDRNKLNCSITNIELVSKSQESKLCGLGNNLQEYWNNRGYDTRDREYEYKISMKMREKIWSMCKKTSGKKISEKLGINHCTVCRIIKEKIDTIDNKQIGNYIDKNLNENDKTMIITLHKSGTSFESISEFYKIKKNIVEMIVAGEMW